MTEQDVRWKQRFENLEKAFKRLLHVKEAYEESAAIGVCQSILNIYLPAFKQVHDDLFDLISTIFPPLIYST